MHSPRLQMMLIVALTGAVGFLTSFTLLHSGVDAMWLRYSAAVAIAYAAFLFFLWCWLRLKSEDVIDGLELPVPGSGSDGAIADHPWQGGGGRSGGGGASGSWDDGPAFGQGYSEFSPATADSTSLPDAAGAIDLEELGLVLLAIAALLGAAWAVLSIVWVAPALFAELLLDAALAAGLYRRLRSVDGDHWLRTAVSRTGWRFAGVAALFAVAGALMQLYAPEARSIGQVMQHQSAER
jgi:hypothetical protein